MSTSAGNPNPSSSQPSSSVPLVTESLGSQAPKEKKLVSIDYDGSVVGEHSEVWSSRTGDFVRAHIPISYENIQKVPKHFKDDVWNGLMAEFKLDVPESVARPFAEKTWPQKFRSYKSNLRTLLRNDDIGTEVVPKGVDPHIWKKFIENESDPKKKQQIVTNTNNRKKLKFSHCLGRRSYSQKHYLMQQENPGKNFTRVEKWLVAHEHIDGTPLESAKSTYDEVKAAGIARNSSSLTSEECSNTCEDLDNDELAQVFGKEKNAGVRGVGSRISKRQLLHLGVARSKIEEKKKEKEATASLEDRIITHVDSKFENFQGMMLSLFSKLANANTPPLVTSPSSDIGSHSVHRPTNVAQNLNDVFAMPSVPHPHSRFTPDDKPQVIVCDKFGK